MAEVWTRPLLLRRRDALHAVHAALVFELAVDFVAADQRDHFLQTAHRGIAGGGDFHLPAARFREARVHAENLVGEQRSFVAAGARANFKHDVFVVVGIFGQQQELEVLLDLRDLRLQSEDLVLRHGAHIRIGLLHHRARLAQILVGRLPLAILTDHFLHIALGLGHLAIRGRIVDQRGIRHLRRQIFEAALEIVEPVLKLHEFVCRRARLRDH